MPQEFCYWTPSATCRVALGSEPNKIFIIGSNATDRREYIEKIMNSISSLELEPRFALDLKRNNGYYAFCRNICTEIRSCRFVVADLSGSRVSKSMGCKCGECQSEECEVQFDYQFSTNVFWEYGYASGMKKRILLICDENQHPPFDVCEKDIEYYNSENLEEMLTELLNNELEANKSSETRELIDITQDFTRINAKFDEKLTRGGQNTDLEVRISIMPTGLTTELFDQSMYDDLKNELMMNFRIGPRLDSISNLELFGELRGIRDGLMHIDNIPMGGSIIISRVGNIVYFWHYSTESDNKWFPTYYLSAYLFTFFHFLKDLFRKLNYDQDIKYKIALGKLRDWKYSAQPDFMRSANPSICERDNIRPIEGEIMITSLNNNFIMTKVEEILTEILLEFGHDGGFKIRSDMRQLMDQFEQ